MDDTKKSKLNRYLLLVIAGLICLPLMREGIPSGIHLQTSLSRIEAIKEGIGHAFPIRIQPLVGAEGSYATGFQADVFLLIPALLRLLGVGVELSYKIVIVLINLATAVISYQSFEKLWGKKEIAIIGSMLYTWNPYRCSDLYLNANLGESIAWTFLPIVLLGMMRLFSNSEEETYKATGGILVTGFSLLALSSIPFFLVSLGAILALYLIMGRKCWNKKTLMCLFRVLVMTVLVNAWFLIPMLLRMRDVSAVESLICENFRMRGMYFVQYLRFFPSLGDNLDFSQAGLVNAQNMGVGAAVVILVLSYMWCLFIKKFSDKQGIKMLCLAAVLMFLSSFLFPWDLLQNKNMLFSVVLALLQSPAKWGVMAGVVLIWIACEMLRKLQEMGNLKLYYYSLACTVLLSFGMAQLFNGMLLRERAYVQIEEAWNALPLQVLTQESFVWRLCEGVSVVVLGALLVMWIVRRKNGVKK